MQTPLHSFAHTRFLDQTIEVCVAFSIYQHGVCTWGDSIMAPWGHVRARILTAEKMMAEPRGTARQSAPQLGVY